MSRTTDVGECASSSVASVFGVAIFLGFLLFASQVMIHLYATSTVTAVAFEAARRAAAAGGDCAREADRARSALGEWGETATVSCHAGEDTTVVRIDGASPARLLPGRAGPASLGHIARAASVRTERAGP